VREQRGRQLHAREILRDQGIVRRLEAELQREVQAGRGLAAARNAHQDDVGLIEVAVRRAVVVRHGKIDGLDALRVFPLVERAVRAADGVAGPDAQARLERIDEGLEEIHEQRIGLAHDGAQVAVHEGGEHDGLAVAPRALRLDARPAVLGLVQRIDERQGDLLELQALELRKQAVAEHLGGDAGAVGDEEHSAALRHAG